MTMLEIMIADLEVDIRAGSVRLNTIELQAQSMTSAAGDFTRRVQEITLGPPAQGAGREPAAEDRNARILVAIGSWSQGWGSPSGADATPTGVSVPKNIARQERSHRGPTLKSRPSSSDETKQTEKRTEVLLEQERMPLNLDTIIYRD
jgi:hypothetical protein